MAKKKITNLDSLMFFTGLNADINAQALENREYNDFKDEYIGELQMTKDYDSVFSYTLSEVFVETTPRYKSIKDITQIAYSYILNKSKEKPTTNVDMYVNTDGVINFDYNFEEHLKGNLDTSKNVSMNDIILFLSSLNNSMFNKQKYYNKSPELKYILNSGVEYNWMPKGSYLSLYDENKNEDYTLEYSNNFVAYDTHKVVVQEQRFDSTTNTYIPVTYQVVDYYDRQNDAYVYKDVPKMINKNVLDFVKSYYELVEDNLVKKYEDFCKTKEENLLSYYIYDLNHNIDILAYTLSFNKDHIGIDINYDGEFNNWFHNRVAFNLSENGIVKITPAEDYYFNFAIKENERIGEDKYLLTDIESSFEIEKNDNISLLSPYKLKKIDFSEVADKLTGELDLLCDYNKKINYKDTIKTNWLNEKGSQLEELIIGKTGVECLLTSINGLEQFKDLKVLDLTGCINLASNPDLSGLINIKDYILTGTNVSVFAPARGSFINSAKLGDSIESIILNDVTFKSKKSLEFDVTDKLTTLEINNVKNLDSYKLVREWVEALDKAGKIAGNKTENKAFVNYVNITDVNWLVANYEVLLKLSQIELDRFTGTIKATGIEPDLYRQDYRKIIDAFGEENVNNPDSDLNIICTVGKNAFNINIEIIEEFNNTKTELNELNETIYIEFVDKRKWNDLVFTVEDTVTGNSFIDSVMNNIADKEGKKEFDEFELSWFVNNNRETIGLSYKLTNKIDLPKNSETLDKVEIGDVLLYGKDILLFCTVDNINVNQNFTRIGKINDTELFEEYLNNDFELKTYFTLTSMEEDMIAPDEDNVIDVEYGNITDYNTIEVEYGQIVQQNITL